MARLSLHLLEPFQALLDGQPIAGFGYTTAQALLAYLAIEADRPHERSMLAGLLCPDWPDRTSSANLRQALHTLRRAIDDDHATPPHLLTTNRTIQFNKASDYWSDVDAFSSAIESGQAHRHRSLVTCTPCMERLAEVAGHVAGASLSELQNLGPAALMGPTKLYACSGDPERAIELAALVLGQDEGLAGTNQEAERLLEEAGGELPQNLVKAVQERGRALDLEETLQELLEALSG
jgi:hypothetical protein